MFFNQSRLFTMVTGPTVNFLHCLLDLPRILEPPDQVSKVLIFDIKPSSGNFSGNPV